MKRVVILYNEPTLQHDHPDAVSEHEIVNTVGAVQENLVEAGYEVHRVSCHLDPGKMITQLQELKPDVVFNLFEGLPELSQTEATVAGILEWLGIPFTGCPALSMIIAKDKPLTKRLFRDALLPTPKSRLIEELPAKPNRLGWPVIVKPSNQDASVGVDQSSVVTNVDDYTVQVNKVFTTYGGPVLVEEFIPGREISLLLFEDPELRALVFWEVAFQTGDPNQWDIITFDAKWRPGTKDFDATPMNYNPTIAAPLEAKMARLGKKAFRLLGCRDFARVDFRVTKDDEPYLLEMNPNPDFCPLAGLSDGLERVGTDHAKMTLQMVQNALARGAKRLAEPGEIQLITW